MRSYNIKARDFFSSLYVKLSAWALNLFNVIFFFLFLQAVTKHVCNSIILQRIPRAIVPRSMNTKKNVFFHIFSYFLTSFGAS